MTLTKVSYFLKIYHHSKFQDLILSGTSAVPTLERTAAMFSIIAGMASKW